jgi:hypothetical protein
VKWLNDKHLNPNKRWPTEALPLENYLFHTIRACGVRSIDVCVQRSWQMLTGESPVVVKVGQPLSQ